MKKNLEALLFLSKEPLTLDEMSSLLESDQESVKEHLEVLVCDYQDRGIVIRSVAGRYEMATSADCEEIARKIMPPPVETEPLRRPALETVSIIAYHQPIPREKIAALRGKKNPDYGILPLLERSLIEEREAGYVTTDRFLRYFGLNDLDDLPVVSYSGVDLLPPKEEEESPHFHTTKEAKKE